MTSRTNTGGSSSGTTTRHSTARRTVRVIMLDRHELVINIDVCTWNSLFNPLHRAHDQDHTFADSKTTTMVFRLQMGKNPKFWVRVLFGFFDDKASVLFKFWVLLKNSVHVGSSSVNVRFRFCSVLYGVQFGFLHIFYFWVWVRFLAKPVFWFGSFLLVWVLSHLYLRPFHWPLHCVRINMWLPQHITNSKLSRI